MIARRFISVFMTALVLACPFLECEECCGMCPEHAALEAEYTASEKDGCPHGHEVPCESDRDPSLPTNHDCPDGCNVSDCICKGAIVPEDTRCPDHDVDNGCFAIAAIDGYITPLVNALHDRDTSHSRSSHFPPLLSGRDICTLVGSHLL